MFGLLLAAIYVVYQAVVNQVDIIVGTESALGFLWGWHVFWGTIVGVIGVFLFLGGICGVVVGKSAGEKGLGLLVGVVGPLLLLLPAGFLLAVYAMDAGISNGEIVNQEYLIGGGVLYAIMAIATRCRSNSSSSSSK